MERTIDEQEWQRLSAELIRNLCDWREATPTATLREIETELDGWLARLRARMLEDLALASARTTWSVTEATAPPTCPQCATALVERGQHQRQLLTHGDQTLTLDRSYGVCPACGTGLFPPR
jgi:hypothetical protein